MKKKYEVSKVHAKVSSSEFYGAYKKIEDTPFYLITSLKKADEAISRFGEKIWTREQVENYFELLRHGRQEALKGNSIAKRSFDSITYNKDLTHSNRVSIPVSSRRSIWESKETTKNIGPDYQKNILPDVIINTPEITTGPFKCEIPSVFISSTIELLTAYSRDLLPKSRFFENIYRAKKNLATNLIKSLESKNYNEFFKLFIKLKNFEQIKIVNVNSMTKFFTKYFLKPKETSLTHSIENLANESNFDINTIPYLSQGCNRVSIIDIK